MSSSTVTKKNSKEKFDIKNFLIQNNTYIIFVILFIACSILSDSFFSVMNIKNLALQQAAPICVALGMLFVIVTGQIDLSVGSNMALGATVTALLIRDFNMPALVAIAIALLAGGIVGAYTGALVAYTKMQGFVASLATMTIVRGLAYVITSGTPVKVEDNKLAWLVSKNYGYPIIYIAVIVVIAFILIQKYTSYGRIVIAVGSNKTAVELAGINAKKYFVSTYALSGVMSVLGGVFVAARAATGSPTVGDGQELDAIAACVIGGASLSGGKGTVFKTVIGALILALIGNIMNLMSVPSYPQDIIKGFIITAAVLLQIVTERNEKTI